MVEKQYEEVLTLVDDLTRFGASLTEAWNMDFRLYRHFVNSRRNAIQDSLNNDRLLYSEQAVNIAKLFSGKTIKSNNTLKFEKLDTDNARRRRYKKNKQKKYAKQRVAAWAAFIHSYHIKNEEDT